MRALVILVVLSCVACGVSLLGRPQAPAGILALDALSDVDKLRIENANLFALLRAATEEADTCRGQLAQPRATASGQQLQDRLAKLKADIEAAHPCCTWNAATGALTPKPPEKKAPQ